MRIICNLNFQHIWCKCCSFVCECALLLNNSSICYGFPFSGAINCNSNIIHSIILNLLFILIALGYKHILRNVWKDKTKNSLSETHSKRFFYTHKISIAIFWTSLKMNQNLRKAREKRNSKQCFILWITWIVTSNTTINWSNFKGISFWDEPEWKSKLIVGAWSRLRASNAMFSIGERHTCSASCSEFKGLC